MAVIAVFAVASVGAVGSARAADALAPPTLAALLAGFRTMPGFEARFEEEKTLALLAAPLTSRGRLFFAPPGTLLRRVETPNPHDILIDDHVVRIATPASAEAGAGAPGGSSPTGRRVETIDLARRADVRPLVESMLWIFSGDLGELASVYAIDYQVLAPASSGRWQLRLEPRREPLSRLIRELAISGHHHGADRLEITETSGDRTTTRILDANPARRFAEGELERLFGLEAR
ncbi:MAG: outer membrane lipoprotein carrier protein LolA [Deltaproteobacteria bacterium]|nr:outer membrane lipoprotein carrier protein LolA [Deltaproteobacteria bacterium]